MIWFCTKISTTSSTHWISKVHNSASFYAFKIETLENFQHVCKLFCWDAV